jgi:hypothetical protein
MRASQSAVPVREIRSEVEGGTSRVSAIVGDQTLWFESDEVALAPVTESFASALLVPALDSGQELIFEQPLSSAWLSNCRQLLRIYKEWWGYDERMPVSPPGEPMTEGGSLRTALCFTAGVDSFYSLLRSGHKVDYLVTGVGLVCTPLGDRVRLEARLKSIREIARKTGTQAIFIRTNFLELPIVARTSWERAHGGVLIALGHLLTKSAARLLISSSYKYESATPWGSHWRTDALGSSGSMQIIHVGAEHNRNEKLWAIADEPLVQRHLHVCWQNLAPVGNCSICDKCVRTRVQLWECGRLNSFSCFRGEASLAGDIEAIAVADGQMSTYRRALARGRGDRRVLKACENLIARTERARNEVANQPVPDRQGLWSFLRRFGR